MEHSAEKKKSRLPLIIALAVAILLAVCFVIGLSHMRLRAERQALCARAEEQMSAGSYESAAEIYHAAGETKLAESAEAMQQQREDAYQRGLAEMASGNYAAAAETLGDYPDYKDVSALIDVCLLEQRYSSACAALDAGEYARAEAAFFELGDFRDSAAKLTETRQYAAYAEAVESFENRSYTRAAEQFAALGDFLDAPKLRELAEGKAVYEQWINLCAEQRIQVPSDAAWLAEPKKGLLVHSDSGKGIYLRDTYDHFETKEEALSHIVDTIPDTTVVDALALNGSYYLIILVDGRVGWATSRMVY